MLGALICFFATFLSSMVDALEMAYVFCFAGVLAVMDTPYFNRIKAVEDVRSGISKYVNFLTRLTGKGCIMLFLSSSLFATMWANLSSHFLLFLAVVLCCFAFGVGLIGVTLGVMKSQKLNKARSHLAQGVFENRYPYHATTFRDQPGGLTPQEFNALTTENGGFKWEDADLKLICSALVIQPSWRPGTGVGTGQLRIPKEDIQTWLANGGALL